MKTSYYTKSNIILIKTQPLQYIRLAALEAHYLIVKWIELIFKIKYASWLSIMRQCMEGSNAT